MVIFATIIIMNRKRIAPHGFFIKHPFLKYLWANIHCRCYKKYDSKFRYYGGKGIKVKITPMELLVLWERDKASLMQKPSLDRIKSDGHYIFGNCRFIEFTTNRMAGLKRAHESIRKNFWTPQRNIWIRNLRKKSKLNRISKTVRVVCYVCIKSFPTTNKRRVFCSIKCAAQWREEMKKMFPPRLHAKSEDIP